MRHRSSRREARLAFGPPQQGEWVRRFDLAFQDCRVCTAECEGLKRLFLTKPERGGCRQGPTGTGDLKSDLEAKRGLRRG